MRVFAGVFIVVSATTLFSWTQTIPDGPTTAAWTQSSADENAQIGDSIPSLSRMHQLSARAADDAATTTKIAMTGVASFIGDLACIWRRTNPSKMIFIRSKGKGASVEYF
jgi:hypothetical protein